MACTCKTAGEPCNALDCCVANGVTNLTTCFPPDPCDGVYYELCCIEPPPIPCLTLTPGQNLCEAIADILEILTENCNCPCKCYKVTNTSGQTWRRNYFTCDANGDNELEEAVVFDNQTKYFYGCVNLKPVTPQVGILIEEINDPECPGIKCTCYIYEITNNTNRPFTRNFTGCEGPDSPNLFVTLQPGETRTVCACSDIEFVIPVPGITLIKTDDLCDTVIKECEFEVVANVSTTTTSTTTSTTTTTTSTSTTTTTTKAPDCDFVVVANVSTTTTSTTTSTTSTSTSTTSTTSTSSTTTSTTLFPCDCHRFTSTSPVSTRVDYLRCDGLLFATAIIPPFGVVELCANSITFVSPGVTYVITKPCIQTSPIDFVCETTTSTTSTTSTSTTTTTTSIPQCDTQITVLEDLCITSNGGFDDDLTDWNISGSNTTWSSIMGGSCAMYVDGLSPETCISQDVLVTGNTYKIEFDVLKIENQFCDYTEIYIDVFAGTTQNGPLLQSLASGTTHIDLTMTCAGNTTFKICAYNPACEGGPFLYIDNVCVTQLEIGNACSVNLFILDETCDPCSSETENPEGTNCFINSNVIPPTNDFQVVRVGLPSYSSNGTAFRSNTSINPGIVLNGENTILQVINTGIWSNTAPNDSVNGPLNRCAIQVTNPEVFPTIWYGYRFAPTCISPNLGYKTFCIGVGGDDFTIEFMTYTGAGSPGNSVNDIVRYQSNIPTWVNPLEKTNYWNVYEITLPINRFGYYIGIWGTTGPFGFEIYDQPMSTLVNAVTIGDLNIVYSSADLTSLPWKANYNFTEIFSGGPQCPTGFYYEACTNSCVAKVECSQNSECLPCTPTPLPSPCSPIAYYGDIEMTYSYTGPALTERYVLEMSCAEISDFPCSIFLGNVPGPYSYTIQFSEPVNNLQLLVTGAGAYGFDNQYEEFIFNTNAGEPQLVSCDVGCVSYVIDNILYAGFDGVVLGSLTFKVDAPSAFTELTISGIGDLAGCIFTICSNDVTNLFEQFPQLYGVKSIYTRYDIVGAPPVPPPPEPEVYSVNTHYSV